MRIRVFDFLEAKTYRPLPSSSLVQCCSHVVVIGLVAPVGVVVVVVVLVVSS